MVYTFKILTDVSRVANNESFALANNWFNNGSIYSTRLTVVGFFILITKLGTKNCC